jgi:L-asparaginase / beta-aspartyl-peptidase
VQESGSLGAPALLVHGGAGTFERLREAGARARLEAGLASALAAGWTVLDGGAGALAAAVEAVASLEDSGLFNAGRGASKTSDGRVETDASVMDGATKAAGAVGAATWPANPVRAALLVASQALDGVSARSPDQCTAPSTSAAWGQVGTGTSAWYPLFFAGAGADRLAEEARLTPMTTIGRGSGEPSASGAAPSDEHGSPGTVGAVALDSSGHLAAATSTGGLEGKPPGRVGDSAIVGAGTWADDETVAVSATGVGEAFILAGFAHLVHWLTRSGTDLNDALAIALGEVSLHRGSGGAIALMRSGRFATVFGTRAMARGWKSAAEMVVRV